MAVHRSPVPLTLAACAMLATASLAQGLGPSGTLGIQLEASLPAVGGEFGGSVAISGDNAVVGAFGSANAAYLFERDGAFWTETKKFTGPLGFGLSVAISGDTAVVGAYGDPHAGQYSGSAFVYVKSGGTWALEQKLTASDASADDEFGYSVAIDGDTILVGASYDFPDRAYVFVRNGTVWTEQQILTSNLPTNGSFGWSVAVSGDTAVVGAYTEDLPLFPVAGAAYVFQRNGSTWKPERRLTASNAENVVYFGYSVAVDGDTILVGTYMDKTAYVFERSGTVWDETQKLTGIDEGFGKSVALDADTAVVGAPGDSFFMFPGPGSATVFTRSGSTWTELQQLGACGPAATDRFGASVAVQGDEVLVGVEEDDHSGKVDAGSAYVYALPAGPTISYCTAGTSASGCQALISASGTASTSAVSGFSLQATIVEGGKDGMFFWGTQGGQANPWGNGTSYACVRPPTTRGGLLSGNGTIGACDGTLAQDLNALWCPTCPQPQKNPGPGAQVCAQLWYRDAFNTANQKTSLSDALLFCVEP